MRRLLVVIIVLAIMGAVVGYYLYNKPKTSMENQTTDTAMEASVLVNEFEKDEAAAELKYLDKTIEIVGIVKEKNESGIVLDSGNEMVGILCEFENVEDLTSVNVKDRVKIKGICTGKLLDVVLSRSIILENK
ncbi:MAG: hypothetical protein WAT79_15625 [Saprospiraceae bacterium]